MDGKSYFVYMSDNWLHGPGGGLENASYIWLPIEFGDKEVRLRMRREWDLENPFAPSTASEVINGDAELRFA